MVFVVTDDMPFLVDSVTAEVVRQGFRLEHVVHPVLVVRRDGLELRDVMAGGRILMTDGRIVGSRGEGSGVGS